MKWFGVRSSECSGISCEGLLVAFQSIEASCSWLEENIGAFLPDVPATGNELNTMTQQLELLSQSVSQHRWLQPPHSVSEASSRINKEMKRQISVHKILLVWASLVASEQEYWKSCQIHTWNSVNCATAIKQKNLFILIMFSVPKTFACTLHLTGSLIQMVEQSN
jgi:hypothetical protein